MAAPTAGPTATAADHLSGPTAKATLDSYNAVMPRTAAEQHTVAKTLTENTYYKVRKGDSLSKIADRFYHNASDWQWLYHENDRSVADPNLIYPGQSLFVPADPPAHYTLPDYQPRHAKPQTSAVTTQSASDPQSPAAGSGSVSLSGTLGCSGLEALWEAAGGNPADAVTAASVAMAESGGRQFALSPTDDYGYWQINISNGPLATFDAFGNARAAIQLSDDGTNWDAWTTYTSGAFMGKC